MKVVALLIPLFVFFLPSCEKKTGKTKEKVVGYKGEAGRNPFLASSRLLEEKHKFIEHKAITKFDVEDHDAVCIPAIAIQSKNIVHKAEEYIADGGHLILMLEYGDRYFDGFRSSATETPTPDSVELLETLLLEYGVHLHRSNVPYDINWDVDRVDMSKESKIAYQMSDSNTTPITYGGSDYVLNNGGRFTFSILESDLSEKNVSSYEVDDLEEHKILTVHGIQRGKLTLIADGRLFRNPHIALDDHAPFLVNLLSEDQSILFSSGSSESFYSLVMKYFPYVLSAILISIVVWLLASYQRFGPVIQFRVAQPVNYLSSIIAGGHFHWKNGDSKFLLESLRKRASKLIGGKSMDNDTYMEIAEGSSITADQIKQALEPSTINQPEEITKTVITLQKIVKHYERES